MTQAVIHVLDETTANKIAAGEVVERPASVVKELVENAIDAKSRTIEVEIIDGGTSFIRVTDDGVGMSPEDAAIAILRHATSKITSVEDLLKIESLGFRGEALPSIAAVSKFSITTRLHNEEMATFVSVVGGVTQDVREAGGNAGTTITVEELFFNTPARKKFLKSLSTESSHINDILTKISISHPEVSFKLINNQRLVLSTPGNGELKDTLASLYGYKITPDILPINYSQDGIMISGYIGKPNLLKGTRLWQTLVVNARVINSRVIYKALDNAYHSLLPKNGYPLVVLQIIIPTETIDVNVHPQKSEVKFSDEQLVYRAVYRAVTHVLTDHSQTPGEIAATVSSTEKFISTNKVQNYVPHHEYVPPAYSKVELWQTEKSAPLAAARDKIYEETGTLPISQSLTVEDAPGDKTGFMLQPLGQIADCYIVARSFDGLYIIDQHAAHERILYDRIAKHIDRIPVQQLLVPLFFDVTPSENNVVSEYANIFYKLGFNLEPIGPDTVRLTEMPVDIPLEDAEPCIRQILQYIGQLHEPDPQEIRHACMQMSACRAAIKAGDTLNMRQMQALLEELCTTDLPYTCPHGRPAMIRFASGDLAKMFKRT